MTCIIETRTQGIFLMRPGDIIMYTGNVILCVGKYITFMYEGPMLYNDISTDSIDHYFRPIFTLFNGTTVVIPLLYNDIDSCSNMFRLECGRIEGMC